MATNKSVGRKNSVIANPTKDEQLAMMRVQMKSSLYSAPLPPPEFLKLYEEVLPGAAKIIFDMAQAQSNHRIGLEEQTVTTNNKAMLRGQTYGMIIAITALIIAGVLAFYDKVVTSSIIGGSTIIALVSIFIKGKSTQITDLKTKKSPQNTEDSSNSSN